MLILTRRENESILIYPKDIPPDMTVAELFSGGQIELRVLAINGNQVKLGFNAPTELKIIRDELEK